MQQSDDFVTLKRDLVALAENIQKLSLSSAAARHSDSLAALAEVMKKLHLNTATAAQSTAGGVGQCMASDSGNDSRANAGQVPSPISQPSDQDAQQQ